MIKSDVFKTPSRPFKPLFKTPGESASARKRMEEVSNPKAAKINFKRIFDLNRSQTRTTLRSLGNLGYGNIDFRFDFCFLASFEAFTEFERIV
jgi:hypothetical protein